jgi:predicted DNA-binding transcriptional regulator YafY
MNEVEKAERILKMLLLLSSGRKYTLSELSEKFYLSERSIQRYIWVFREVGFVIPRPNNGMYFIEKNSPRFKEMSQLLHFSEEEAYILSKAIHSIDDVNILKTNLVRKLYALYDFDRVAVTVVKRENSENVHQLIRAIKNKKQAILHNYQSAHSKVVRDRLIEPFDFTTNYIAVWGFDLEDQTCKTFKTSRIIRVETLTKSWEFSNLHRTKPLDIFRISGDYIGTVKLRLTRRARNLLIEEYPLAEKQITPISKTHFAFEAKVCGWEGVGRFVMGLCDEIKVLDPPGLKQYISGKLKRLNARIK